MRPATLVLLAVLSGCGTVVERIEPAEPRELSGAWNDTDSRLVSEEMVRDLGGWIEAYRLKHLRLPTLVVGEVRNLAKEPIGVATFMADIQRSFIGTQGVAFIASNEERGGAREERKDQDHHASEETRKPMGRERGADFLLTGTISAIVDRGDSTELRYYQVDLALIDLLDNSKAWAGQKKIKKAIRRPLLSDAAAEPWPERQPHRFASQGGGDQTRRASRIAHWECAKASPFPSCM